MTTTRRALAAGLSALTLTALAACSSSSDAASKPTTPLAAEATAKPGRGDDTAFILDFVHSGLNDEVSRAGTLTSAAGTEAGDNDLDAAADKAEQAADIFDHVVDAAPDLMGASGSYGRETVRVADECADVLHDSAEAMRQRDMSGLTDVTTRMNRCGTDLSALADRATALQS